MVIEGSTVDLAIHGTTVMVAAAMSLVAVRAYRRRTRRFGLVAAAFLVFALKEALVAASVAGAAPSLVGITHLLNLVVLLLFFAGVVR